jgi:ornithine carbamoyltransferase
MPNLFDIEDLAQGAWEQVLSQAVDPAPNRALEGAGVALVFEKPSARTRNSTEMAVVGLGGHPVYIQGHEVGIDQRESAEDVARTLACYHRIICARVFDHNLLLRMAAALAKSGVNVPVINLLSDQAHPCQAVADMLTLRELWGTLAGRSIAYIGDTNNMWTSLAKAALLEGMDVRIGAPADYSPSADQLAQLAAFATAAGSGGTVTAFTDPTQAADGADALYTDVWTSMGQEEERAARAAAFAGFTIDTALLAKASSDAVVLVLHCLPAHRGEEISDAVLEGPQSHVWRQAAHRQTAMRGILSWAVQS